MAKSFISTTKFEVVINKAALMNSLTAGANGRISGIEVRRYILPIIEKASKDLVRDFYNHSVTKEIMKGPSANNTSGTLGGYGNLFSFIGFDRGSNPFSQVEDLIKSKLNVRVRAITGGRFRITIANAPDTQSIFEATPYPWASGSSWAEGVEKGMSNLGSYLNRPSGISSSNSGTGIQIEAVLGSRSFKTTSYISGIMNKFLKNVTKF
jgi:hypothetical protein